ncbi:unnamed protein product [Mytilus coruscus]|uniref:Ig-like domain-containing protein n=1 Tax=Mytilus coruscus TaxID=42192 RepID=A0A6J8AJE8_MYTCO|nr:unnamed protein product [Mytilus coruscus]
MFGKIVLHILGSVTVDVIVDVSLKIASEAVLIGLDIVLTCTVHGIETIDRKTTRQWSKGNDDELLCYNGRINNLRKYEENVLAANEFSLTIINVTKVDLNVLYQCRYGFDAASKFIQEDEPILFLSLRLVTDFIIFGGYIILTCTVNGISTLDCDIIRQWSMGSDDKLLSYNGRINNHIKYEETVLPGNEFSLKIFNVTEADVNVTYRCRYGFDSANTFIKLNEYNYVNPPTPVSTSIRYFLEKEMDTIIISVYFKKVFPVPNCSLNIDTPNFDITDLSEYGVDMDVNLSLRLQRRVACDQSFNISCLLGKIHYDVGYLTIKDECSIEVSWSVMVLSLVSFKRCDSRARSSAKSRSANLLIEFYCIPVVVVSNACFVTLYIAIINCGKENNQLCLSPEHNWKGLMNDESSITWHVQSKHHHNHPFKHTFHFINADFEKSSCYCKKIGYSTNTTPKGRHEDREYSDSTITEETIVKAVKL